MLNPSTNRGPLPRKAKLIVSLLASCLLLPLAVRLGAQNASTKLTGTVFDISGGAVPNATITVTNKTLFSHSATDGIWRKLILAATLPVSANSELTVRLLRFGLTHSLAILSTSYSRRAGTFPETSGKSGFSSSQSKGCESTPICTLIGCREIRGTLLEGMAGTTGLEPAASAVIVPSGTLRITNLHVDSEFVIVAEVNDVVAAVAAASGTTQALSMDRKQKRCPANRHVRIIDRGFDGIHREI